MGAEVSGVSSGAADGEGFGGAATPEVMDAYINASNPQHESLKRQADELRRAMNRSTIATPSAVA